MKVTISKKFSFCTFLVLLFIHNPLFCEVISVNIIENTAANADFRPGDKNKPAVFLLHGFMSTHNLNIIQVIAEELEDQGYTVLAPTLSLNINNRQSGINCDAVHTHTMESDVVEIGKWIDWLKNKGHNDIIMAGFSTGALQISIYLSKNKPKNIKKAVLISPAYLAGEPFPVIKDKTEIATANKMLAENNNQLHNFYLSYCKGNFTAPPEVFLSYKKWTDSMLLKAVKQIPVPKSILIGGEDHRFGNRLEKKLKMINSKVITISGANHFFDSPHEFDFLDIFTQEIAAR